MLIRGVPVSAPVPPPVPPAEGRDCLHGRARAAEARVAELEGRLTEPEARALEWRRESVQARSGTDGLRTAFGSSRGKPAASRADLRDMRRSRGARNVRGLETEVARLRGLLKTAGIDGRRNPVTGLRREIARPRDVAARRAEGLEGPGAGNGRLRPARETHAQARSGGRGGSGGKSGSGRGRGQRAGGPGHGRTPRPETERRPGTRGPPEADRACPCRGLPYVLDGSHGSGAVGIGVRAHVRTIRRSRWRRSRGRAPAPRGVAAPPVPRLFPDTACGTGFRARFPFGRHARHRPPDRVAAWMRDRGPPVSAGTPADSIRRLMPLFAPLPQAIPGHMKGAGTLHGDGTGWRVQPPRGVRGTGRARLWRAASRDAVWFRVDARRNAGAAGRLFADVARGTVPVCDAYSACRKPARVPGGIVALARCRAHVRRKFIQAAAGNDAPDGWRDRWLDRIGRLFRLNRVRIGHCGPEAGMERRPRRSGTAHRQLQGAVDRLFALAEREPAGPAGPDRRIRRGPVTGRKLPSGSGGLEGARFPAMMYGISGTLRMNGTGVRRWPDDWLAACAGNGGQPPDGPAPWLPRSMDGDRRRALEAAE